MKHLNIVLVEPEIPQNTGNISRTCACTGASLHLVRPLGFSIDDAHLKRAGLDYWKYLDVTVHDSLEAFLDFAKGKPMRLASTKAAKNHTEKDYPNDCFILFGKESRGLPESLLKEKVLQIGTPLLMGVKGPHKRQAAIGVVVLPCSTFVILIVFIELSEGQWVDPYLIRPVTELGEDVGR